MELGEILITSSLAAVAITLVAFIIALHSGQSSKGSKQSHRRSSSLRHPLNRLAAIIVIVPVGFVIPQLFISGRTEAQCHWLHHWAGTLTFVAIWLIQNYYLLRSNQIATHTPTQLRLGRALQLALTVISLFSAVEFNLVLETFVDDDGLCIAIVNATFTGVFGYLIPILFEIAANLRFIWLVSRSAWATRSSTDTAALRRLVRLTCALSLITLGVDAIMDLVLQGVIEIADPTLIPLLIAAESTYSACAVAWPVILISAMKWAARGAAWKGIGVWYGRRAALSATTATMDCIERAAPAPVAAAVQVAEIEQGRAAREAQPPLLIF